MGGYATLNGALRQYDALGKPRLLTTGLTQLEAARIEGDYFSAQWVGSVAASGGVQYIQFLTPTASEGVIVGLAFRELMCDSGNVEFSVYWNFTGAVSGAAQVIYNENQISSNVSKSTFETVTSVTGEGDLRERFILPAGQGNKSQGQINGTTGFRIYAPDNGFLVKIQNFDNAPNKTVLTYQWVEAPPDVITP